MESDGEAGGDLGLGRGLKPGALTRNYESDPENQPETPSCRNRHEGVSPFGLQRRCQSLCVDGIDKQKSASSDGALTNFTDKLKRLGKWNCKSAAYYDDVTARKESSCEILESQRDATESLPNSRAKHCSNSTIQEKLWITQQEVEELKQNLELCQMQLDAKYQATKILQQQLAVAKKEKEVSSKRSECLNRNLTKELNRVHFELECHGSKLLESQEKWSAKFDSICLENLRLVAAMEEQTLEQRRLFADKMALSRECDELIALLHIQDRNKYDSLQHFSSDQNGFTSLELAVIGACHCQSESHSPCTCAIAAACLKKEISQNKEQMEELKRERDDALTMADVYRIAFEEQLSCNRNLLRRMAKFCSSTDSDKNSCSIALESNSSPTTACLDERNNGFSTDEIMNILQETVMNKCEALVHQKFATRMLASQVKQLKEKLSVMQEETVAVEPDKTQDFT